MRRQLGAFYLAMLWLLLPHSAFCRDNYASDVYEALAASAPDKCPMVIASHTEVAGMDDKAAREYARMLGLSESIAKRFAAANKVPHSVPWKPTITHVEFLDPPAVNADDGGAAWLSATQKIFPCVHYVCSFSAVAALHEDAMVKVNRFCGTMCGGGSDIVYLRAIHGRWQVAKGRRLQIN